MNEPLMESAINQIPSLNLETVSFRDKLMNKVNLVQNVVIDIQQPDSEYDDHNDDDDTILSYGDRGPSIKFSERVMDCFANHGKMP